MHRPIGQRVRIKCRPQDLQEFNKRVGTITDVERQMNGETYYRVVLDEPVEVPNVGLVRSDLWHGSLLETLRIKYVCKDCRHHFSRSSVDFRSPYCSLCGSYRLEVK